MRTYQNNKELLKKVKEKNENTLQELILSNEGLIVHCLRKYEVDIPGFTSEDLMQEGRMKLMDAALFFNPAFNLQFSTYAYRCLKNHFIKLKNDHNHTEVFYDNLSSKEKKSFYSQLRDPNEMAPDVFVISREYERELLENAKLSQYEHEILYLKLEGFKNKEIAEMLDKSAGSVDTVWGVVKKKVEKVIA
jgi:RNA polymerase sporulation-specific sigma factor